MPKVSVIVTSRNSAGFLPRCVDSILAQTETGIEVLLVNDGSSGISAEWLARYEARDGRVRCIHKANGGLASMRNAGLAQAKGDYLLFVDGGDWLEPTLVADACAAAATHSTEQELWNRRKAKTIDIEKLERRRYLYRRDVIQAHQLGFLSSREIFAQETAFAAMYLLHTPKLVTLSAALYHRQDEATVADEQRPGFARQLITLGIRLADYAEQAGRLREVRRALPILFYRLAIQGLAGDASAEDAAWVVSNAKDNATLRSLLRGLFWGGPLRGRAFAWAWLRGRAEAALRLAGRK